MSPMNRTGLGMLAVMTLAGAGGLGCANHVAPARTAQARPGALSSSQPVEPRVPSPVPRCARPKSSPPYRPRPGNPLGHALPRGSLPERPIVAGDAFTVWGASYYLRSRVHRRDVTGKTIRVVGYITKTNLPDAPRCAVHATGLADPDDCSAPLPAFWLADDPKASTSDAIRVLGWASNYAQIHDAIAVFDRDPSNGRYVDEFWGVPVPNPLPAAGAKVVVTGTYGPTFTKSSAGIDADPIMGLLDVQQIEIVERAPALSTLPGIRRSPKYR